MVSQAERIYNHLQEHGFITNAQSNEIYGFRHLPAIIRDIKKKYGVEIETKNITGCNRFGDRVWWKKYILKEGA
jgi:hypothetical protein